MKFIIHANNVEWQREYLPRFVKGLASKGHQVVHSMEDVADETGINIIFANNAWKLTHQQCMNKKIPIITVGRCFFGSRHNMVAIGWDGFNGCADFCLDDWMPADRWEKHGGWQFDGNVYGNPDGYVLLCGEFREMTQWYNTMREILAGNDVRFRPHPFKTGQGIPGWQLAPAAGQDAIATLFPDCRAVITYDSIAGCDAALAGVPSIACGKYSMARDASFHSWRHFLEWEKTCDGYPFDFEVWASRLAYCQWSHDEIESGDWWDHLEVGCEKRLTAADEHHLLSHTTKMRKHHRLVKWKSPPPNSRLSRRGN